MNHTSKKTLQFAAMILAGATFFMGGCGPENLDDPTYLADLDSESASDAADKSAAPMDKPMDDQANVPAAVPPAGAVVTPAAVVQLPEAFVELPSEHRAQPPIVTQSGEQINYNRRILFQKDIHVAQPAIEQHLVTKNVHTHRQYQTNVINHPSFRRDVAFAHTASESAEVLPTTVVTAPTAAARGVVAPAIPYCAPWYSGGMLRACGHSFRYPWLR